jgi:hypothetical protein
VDRDDPRQPDAAISAKQHLLMIIELCMGENGHCEGSLLI